MTIQEIALQKKAEYEKGYREWCLSNPGKIMNGLTSKSMCMDFAKHCDSIEELEILHKIYTKRAKELTGPHGFNFFTSAITELIQMINNE